MKDKFFKFHFKNDRVSKVQSFDVENLDQFSDALKFAYDTLDNLNEKEGGYRIVGIYEILYPANSYNPNQIN